MKKLIAYSSVAHMGFVTMGIFAMTAQGVQGGIFQMLSHGIVSGALFLCVGVIYDRMHTREIAAYGGLVNRMPLYALVFMVFTMANVGLPGTSGFVGEFLTLLGAFRVNTWVAFIATTGVILSAAYALWLYRRIIFGPLEKASLRSILDLSRREQLILAPLVVLTHPLRLLSRPDHGRDRRVGRPARRRTTRPRCPPPAAARRRWRHDAARSSCRRCPRSSSRSAPWCWCWSAPSPASARPASSPRCRSRCWSVVGAGPDLLAGERRRPSAAPSSSTRSPAS